MENLPRLLNAQECAILLLRLIELRNEEASAVSRVRISEQTLRRLFGRSRLSREFLDEVQEWLNRGGWTLFYAHTTFAAVRTSAVLSWSRISSKRLKPELEKVQSGEFDFASHLHLISSEIEELDD